MKKQRVYISGQITGLEKEEYTHDFENACKRLESLGFEPVNPLVEVPYQEGKTWWEYLGEDIIVLGTCQAIYMMRNWGSSDGAKIEQYTAQLKRMPTVYAAQSDEEIVNKLK